MIQLKTKKRLIIFFFTLLMLTQLYTLSDFNSNLNSNKDKTLVNTRNKITSYTVSDPISITSDTEFATQATNNGWPGSGTSIDPYIIENLQIVNTTNSTNGISISGSGITKYFVIRNNYIEMTGYNSNGIYLKYINNLGTIENNTIYNNTYGLRLDYCSYITVRNNTITNNSNYGFYSYSSSHSTIEYNSISENNNTAGIGFYPTTSSYNIIQYNNISYNDEGIWYNSNDHDIIHNNTFSHNINYALHGGSLTYTNVTDNDFSYQGSSIMYFQSSTSNLIFSGNTFEHNTADGVRFASGAINNTFSDNLFLDNQYGIWSNVGQSNVYNNTFIGNQYGLRLISSLNGVYENNTFINNNYAMQISSGANNNYVFNNTFLNNTKAIDVVFGDNNTFYDNNIINNTNGISVTFADNNTFYGNNLLRNSVQASASYADNYFDNGFIGNFWLDYVINAVDSNKDGVGDSSYLVSSSYSIYDHYPLMIWHDEKLPLEILNTVSNVTYSEGNAINYTWKLVDESPDTYVIFQNGSPVQSGSWMSFLSDEYINTPLPQVLGLYNYTIVVNDTDGNVVSDTAFVNVIDIIAPTITGLTLYSYNETTPNHFVDWNVTDNHPNYYYVYKDGVLIDSNTWTANSTITIDVSGLLKNTYNYTIEVYDTSNNINKFTTFIEVYDGTPPNVTDYGNQTIESGSTGVSLNWTATDNYPAYYEIYNNSVLIANNTWTSNVNISQIISTYYLGEYNFSIIVYDDSGNNITSTIFITFVDTTNPVITSNPANNTIDISYTGNIISWGAMDFFPSQYTLYDNNSVFATGIWNTDSVNFNLDSLAVGMHNLTIVFNDTSGNLVFSTVWVTVITDTVPPSITSQPTVTVFQDIQSGKSVSWTAIDDKHPANYTLYINGNVFSSGTWMNNTAIVIPFSGLTAGVYNFTINFNDTMGNLVSDTVWITIFADVLAPQIVSSPSNTTYADISTGNDFSWQIIDDLGASDYIIYVDGSIYSSGAWTNNTMLTKNFDGLPAGLHNITAFFNDTSNNNVYNTFWINVTSTDFTAPVITSQPSTTMFQDIQSGKTVAWTAIDNFGPNKYSLYINGTNYSNGNWQNNSAIIIPFSGLSAGVYNFTIFINDTAGNIVNDTVWITIFADVSDPQIVSSPSNTTYADISAGNDFSWQVIDDLGASDYIIYVDGSVYVSGSWSNNTLFIQNMDGLSVGLHNVTAFFNDTSSNYVYSTFWITVTYTDNLAPTITMHPTTTVFQDTDPNKNVSWTAIDEFSPGYYTLYINGSLYASNSWQNATGMSIPFNGLPVGLYNFTISINDTAGNTIYNTIWITIVSDHIAPQITGMTEITYVYGSTGQTLTIQASDDHPDYYEIYKNGNLISYNPWNLNTIGVAINLNDLVPGIYNYTFVFYDQFGNVASHTVLVTVQSQTTTNQTTSPTTTPTTTISTDINTSQPNTSASSSSPSSTTSLTTITQQLTSNMDIFGLFISLSFILFLRSKRK